MTDINPAGTTNAGESTNTPSTSSTTGAPLGSLSTVSGALPGTTLSPTQMSAITNENIKNATAPELADAETAVAVNQQVKDEELLTNQTINPTGVQAGTNANQLQASTVQQTAQAEQPDAFQAATYTAKVVDPVAIASATQAVTSSLPSDALVSTQLQKLLTPDANGNLPAWVQPAVTAANQMLAGRGISNTTMAGQAITSAILTSSMTVASANASAEYNAWSKNLDNKQAAALQQGAIIAQTALSNQGAENAAANFNATSENQTNQYLSSLAAQINQFNTTQTNAIAQFNASQSQTATTSRVQLQAQLDEYNATMANQREQFNVQNAIIVQQANAEYLRQVNTANTAVQNQVNQMNAQNAYNLSTQAMANLQQQFNDEATMLYNANMTAEEQNYALTYLSQQYGLQEQLDKTIISLEAGANFNSSLGTLVGNLFSSGGAVSTVVNSLFGKSTDTPSGNTNTGNTDTSGDSSTWLGDAFDYVGDGISDAADWLYDLF